VSAVPPLDEAWANVMVTVWLATGDTLTVGVAPVGSVCEVASAYIPEPLMAVTAQ
jgi:hypothetical protein